MALLRRTLSSSPRHSAIAAAALDAAPGVSPAKSGIGRSWQIFQAMRNEQTDPAAAYQFMASDTAALVEQFRPLSGAVAIDVGGGPGYTAEAFRGRGASAFTVDPFIEELSLHGRAPTEALVGDGLVLPLATGSVDVVCTLNALEHVADPWAFLGELVRVASPGGLIFIGVTNWLSPWGGHETSPWHYLGGERAARRYRVRHGVEAKNRFGDSLFRVGIGDLLRWSRQEQRVEILDAFPRYYPRWCRRLVRVPAVREVATWNLALVLERTL